MLHCTLECLSNSISSEQSMGQLHVNCDVIQQFVCMLMTITEAVLTCTAQDAAVYDKVARHCQASR